jgi:hypothetical protein
MVCSQRPHIRSWQGNCSGAGSPAVMKQVLHHSEAIRWCQDRPTSAALRFGVLTSGNTWQLALLMRERYGSRGSSGFRLCGPQVAQSWVELTWLGGNPKRVNLLAIATDISTQRTGISVLVNAGRHMAAGQRTERGRTDCIGATVSGTNCDSRGSERPSGGSATIDLPTIDGCISLTTAEHH